MIILFTIHIHIHSQTGSGKSTNPNSFESTNRKSFLLFKNRNKILNNKNRDKEKPKNWVIKRKYVYMNNVYSIYALIHVHQLNLYFIYNMYRPGQTTGEWMSIISKKKKTDSEYMTEYVYLYTLYILYMLYLYVYLNRLLLHM